MIAGLLASAMAYQNAISALSGTRARAAPYSRSAKAIIACTSASRLKGRSARSARTVAG